MADKRSGTAIHPPESAAINTKAPSKVSGVGVTDHYLDGAPLEEVDGIRIVQVAESGPQSASVCCDFLDPTDLPAASGTRHTQLGNTGTFAFVVSKAQGLLRLTTGAVNGNAQSFVRLTVGQFPVPAAAVAGPPFVASKRAWYTTSITIPTGDSVSDGSILVGLVIDNWAGTSIGTLPTDGLFFRKVDTASDFTFEARKNATSTTLSNILATAGVTLTLNVPVELSFRISPEGTIFVYVNGIHVGSVNNGDTNIPYTPSAAGHDLTPGFFRGAGAGAAARKLDIDYYLCAQELT